MRVSLNSQRPAPSAQRPAPSAQLPALSSQLPAPSSQLSYQFSIPSPNSQVLRPKFYPLMSSRQGLRCAWSAYGASAYRKRCPDRGEPILKIPRFKCQTPNPAFQTPGTEGQGEFGKSWTLECVLQPKSQERKNDTVHSPLPKNRSIPLLFEC